MSKSVESQGEAKAEPSKTKLPKPTPRMHIDEFLLNSDLRREQMAGFRVFVGSIYNSEKDWKAKLEEYNNRKYQGGVSE